MAVASLATKRMLLVALLVVASIRAVSAQAVPEFSLLQGDYIEIGALGGPSSVEFVGIVAALLLENGEVVVADGGDHRIHWLDGAGNLIRTLGQEGAGPAEFRGLHWLGSCSDGELIAIDPINRRATFLARNSRVVGTRPLPPVLRFAPPLVCQSADQLLVLMDRPGQRGTPGRVTAAPASVVRIELMSGAVDTLLSLPGTDFYFASGSPGYSYLPLGARSLATVGRHRLYAAQTDEETIRVVDLRSGDSTSFQHGLPRAPVTRSLWDAEVRAMIEEQPLRRTRELLAGVLAEAQPPDLGPAFQSMHADRMDRLWIQPASGGSNVRWRVMYPGQGVLFFVTLPAAIEPLDIGHDRLVALARDSLGVQSIRIYPLPETPGPEGPTESR